MTELNEELWKLGVLAKTEHNEVAPAQHEMAPIFSISNVSADHNQLTMEMMRKVAGRHGLVCLLHEKPFAGVNGSGKHNNWSMSTNTGYNLLEPGSTPYESAQFLLFLTAVIKAVDDYQDLLRVSVASAGNDHRLGANEAPPAIISMFLGDELTGILDALDNGTAYVGPEHTEMAIGVHVLPKFPKDTTDRNRTSPFAFTGNKFEFRSLGSSASISDANVVINTIVAESLRQFADELEGAEDFQGKLHDLIVREIRAHKRIVFNGNGYSDEWVAEAEKRGLLNLKSTVDALPYLIQPKNIDLFTRHRIYSATEIHSRYEIMLENYTKVLNIEAETALMMAKKQILPAVMKYSAEVASEAGAVKALCADLPVDAYTALLGKLSNGAAALSVRIDALQKAVDAADRNADALAQAAYQHDVVIPAMLAVRETADEMEPIVSKDFWPFPTYDELLFNV